MATVKWLQRSSKALIAMLVLTPVSLFAQEGFKGGHQEAIGKKFTPATTTERVLAFLDARARPNNTTERVRYWNGVAVDSSGLDHTPVSEGETRVFGEQLGPHRASRAMAIVHIAMFDALNATRREFRSYSDVQPILFGANGDAALAQAAHDTLVALFPSQRSRIDTALREDLERIRGPHFGKVLGSTLGKRAAAAILARRATDGSQYVEPKAGSSDFPLIDQPGAWKPDPVSQGPLAMGAFWGKVQPFGIDSVTRFRLPPPPALNSKEYAAAFAEAKRLGGDGVQTATERSAEQGFTGIFWAYDGTPSLCAPPRLFNQIALHIAEQQNTNEPLQLLRLLTLANVAMADATTVAWEGKFFYNLWRPVTAIREADRDGNPDTSADPEFMPNGAPATNLHGPNFTPPFPTYPSGHATMGGAFFQVLRRFYGTDKIAFTFVSDELNGTTVDNRGAVRALLPHTFDSFSAAEHENGMSRIYLGIHWSFDSSAGIHAGNQVGDYVFDHLFKRLR